MKFISIFVLFATLYVNVSSLCDTPKQLKVREYVWVDDCISEAYKTSVYVANGSSLYTVMGEAAKHDKNFEFESIFYNGLGQFITKIAGHEQNPVEKVYWFIYITDGAPKKNNPPGPDKLSPLGVSNLQVVDQGHYLFWLKKQDAPHP